MRMAIIAASVNGSITAFARDVVIVVVLGLVIAEHSDDYRRQHMHHTKP